MVRKKQHNDGLVDGNIHSKKRPSTTKFQYPESSNYLQMSFLRKVGERMRVPVSELLG